jgi:hypothetical protein
MRYMMRERLGYRGVVGDMESASRAAYDANEAGEAAPHTDWISITSLRAMCKKFSAFKGRTENIDQEPPFERRPRKELLGTIWPRICGLDLYATAVK